MKTQKSNCFSTARVEQCCSYEFDGRRARYSETSKMKLSREAVYVNSPYKRAAVVLPRPTFLQETLHCSRHFSPFLAYGFRLLLVL